MLIDGLKVYIKKQFYEAIRQIVLILINQMSCATNVKH